MKHRIYCSLTVSCKAGFYLHYFKCQCDCQWGFLTFGTESRSIGFTSALYNNLNNLICCSWTRVMKTSTTRNPLSKPMCWNHCLSLENSVFSFFKSLVLDRSGLHISFYIFFVFIFHLVLYFCLPWKADRWEAKRKWAVESYMTCNKDQQLWTSQLLKMRK